VFIGDEGITEASDATKRLSFELFTRIKLLDWLWLRGDITNTTAEFHGSGDAIPLARRFTARGDLTARLPFGLSATLQAFYIGKRHLMSRAVSRTVRVSGPTWSSDQESGTTPWRLTRPYVGFNPTNPHRDAGIRTEPPVSVPKEP
jgi:hypothetical protein